MRLYCSSKNGQKKGQPKRLTIFIFFNIFQQYPQGVDFSFNLKSKMQKKINIINSVGILCVTEKGVIARSPKICALQMYCGGALYSQIYCSASCHF
jgi:hypothetical protein